MSYDISFDVGFSEIASTRFLGLSLSLSEIAFFTIRKCEIPKVHTRKAGSVTLARNLANRIGFR